MDSRLDQLWDKNKTIDQNLTYLFETDLDLAPQERKANGFQDERYSAYKEYKKIINLILEKRASKNLAEFLHWLKDQYNFLECPLFKTTIKDISLETECINKITFAIKKIEEAIQEENRSIDKKSSGFKKTLENSWNQNKNLLENIRSIFERDLSVLSPEYDPNGFFNKRWCGFQDYKRIKHFILNKLNSKNLTEENFYAYLVIELHTLNHHADDRELRNELAVKINFALQQMEQDNPSLSAKRSTIIEAYEEEKERQQNLAY